MATSYSNSSSQEPLYPTPTQPPPSKPTTSRRLPPPCWSDAETVALIDAYRNKWYSLQRGNLRGPDWQEVADGVAVRCPLGNTPKTSIQCRHKMEKLRKRYRAEIGRIGNGMKAHSWVHFRLMENMELGFSCSGSDPVDLSMSNMSNEEYEVQDEHDNENEKEEELMLYPKGIKPSNALPLNRRYQGNQIPNQNGNRVRIKIPNDGRLLDDLPPSITGRYGSGTGARNGYGGIGGGMKREGNVMSEMVGAIHKLADGFVKMERMKMDVAREIESMRMKTERKRTEMILETQRKMWDSFSNTVLEMNNKKVKRMPSPES